MADEHDCAAMDRLAENLTKLLGPAAVLADQTLARHTAFRIGGPADLLVVVESSEALRKTVIMAWEYQVPCRVLGGGSNVLVSDDGVRGLVILNRWRRVTFGPPESETGGKGKARVQAASGASFSTLARQCAVRGLAGLEWAAGIPGSVGGAVIGNAGAWGGDVSSTLIQAAVLQPKDRVEEWPAERFRYGYRSSLLKQEAGKEVQQAVVLDAEFALTRGRREILERRIAEIVAQRKASQPRGATCGSVFKNPPGDYAGRLVEAAGLKGTRRGGAEISPVHANFIVNQGGASAADVKALIDLARQAVHTQFGRTLELEIQLIGEWGGSGSGEVHTNAEGSGDSQKHRRVPSEDQVGDD